jgi:hypothetical protein
MARIIINDSGLKKLISTLFINLYTRSFLTRFTNIDNNFNDCYSSSATNASNIAINTSNIATNNSNIKSFGLPFGSL